MASCTLREVKSVRDTIRFYEDEILNYFDGRKTNASAESLNSKIKCFRAQVKGVIDMPFFMYRLATVFGLVSAQPSTGFVGCANNTFSSFLIIHYQSSYSLSFLSHQLKHWDILG